MDRVICEIRYDEGIRFFDNDLCGTLRTISECGNKHIIEADKIKNEGGRKRMIEGNIRIRKLTPTECYKLMGFEAEDCKKASEGGISNSQLYKQAGNSIVVNVLEAIFTELGKTYQEFSVCG
jgi:DNA (cytosine-5)-methyltransferase 1